ncbi:MAG TPA: response regulator [Tepidisphaeraceae bacterium]|nr:response regulator [Tepidisphaeraceae bacterium]
MRTAKLLALDEDDSTLGQIARVASGHYSVMQLKSPSRALGLLEADPSIEVFVTEHVMRFGNGVELLETVRTMRPEVRRVMLTNYSDLAGIVLGLHSGAIQQLVQKPAGDLELLHAISPAVAQQRAAVTARRLSA